MSYQTFNQCARMKIFGVPKSVLMVMAVRAADEDGYCFQSIETLAMETGFKRRALIEAIQKLEALGVIVANRSNGRNTTYMVTPGNFQGELFASKDKHQRAKRTGAPDAPVREEHSTSAPDAHDQCAKRTLIVINANESNTPLPPNGGESDFEQFEKLYPRRTGMEQAARQWAELSTEDHAAALLGVKAWVPSPEWQRESGRFIPRPAKWLKDKRWRDAPGASAATPLPLTQAAEQPSPRKAVPVPPELKDRISALLSGHVRPSPQKLVGPSPIRAYRP